ncbi:hypothetical protein F5148DRAFT_1253142 [Russula earlei]|uniref:Uncharacterized protein n=1 Tax=Russula earlei TaxID=71964 RepID=A0ACC0TUW2_9AGAM|nr:hypothetical protein F5148DRAFT_1253142 [Russula earlei]
MSFGRGEMGWIDACGTEIDQRDALPLDTILVSSSAVHPDVFAPPSQRLHIAKDGGRLWLRCGRGGVGRSGGDRPCQGAASRGGRGVGAFDPVPTMHPVLVVPCGYLPSTVLCLGYASALSVTVDAPRSSVLHRPLNRREELGDIRSPGGHYVTPTGRLTPCSFPDSYSFSSYNHAAMTGETFSERRRDCQKYFLHLANARGESPSAVVNGGMVDSNIPRPIKLGTSERTCDRVFLEWASAWAGRRSKLGSVPSYREGPTTTLANHHPFREAVKAAGVRKWACRDSGDSPSATQPSRAWTAAQILTPILVALVLCLSFVLYLFYKSGRLPRLASNNPFMRRSRRPQLPRRWTINDDAPNRAVLHDRDPEVTPILSPHPHWTSLSPHDATDRQRFSGPRSKMAMLTPAFSSAFRSIRRLFGVGPIPVSRVPVPAAFDLEDTETETDLFDTLRSNSSRSCRNGTPTQAPTPLIDRALSSQNLAGDLSGSSAALDLMLDYGRGYDEEAADFGRDGGVDDHDSENGGAENEVMLISRDGEDFSMEGSMVHGPLGNQSPVDAEVNRDRRSIEVVPPTPILSKQSFRFGAYHTRSSVHSPPHDLFSDSFQPHPFYTSTHDLSSLRFPRTAPSSHSPTPVSAPLAASNNGGGSGTRRRPSHERPNGAQHTHFFTEATPPIDPSDHPSTHPPPPPATTTTKMSSTFPLSPDARSGLLPSSSSSSSSSSSAAAPAAKFSPSVPSSPINASDPQNLIPSAVRGAGYNPFQHTRSASEVQ